MKVDTIMSHLGLFPSTNEKLKVAFQVLANRLQPVTCDTDSFRIWNEKRCTWKKIKFPLVNCTRVMDEVIEIHGMKVYTEDDQIFITDENLKYQFPKYKLGMILLRMQKVLKCKIWKQ
jgi:hypothetical protein